MPTRIKIVGTSSSGNGYLIESGDQILIIECGLPFKNFLSAMNYEIGFKKLVGGIITHRHSDHLNKSTVSKFIKMGVPIFSHEDVCNFDNEIKPIKFNEKNKIGEFYIQMFKVSHDVPNVGYLIDCPTGERILFITDTQYISYKFKNLDCIMIECNNDFEEMMDNNFDNEESRSHPENHLSLYDCLDICKTNMALQLQKIILIHLSSDNINPNKALSFMKEELSFLDVYVAHSEDVYEIDKDGF